MGTVEARTKAGRALIAAFEKWSRSWDETSFSGPLVNGIAAIEAEAIAPIRGAAQRVIDADGLAESGALGADQEWDAALAGLVAALVDMTAAYHLERTHGGKWDACQKPRCQNARLATEGRGPYAANTPPSESQRNAETAPEAAA